MESNALYSGIQGVVAAKAEWSKKNWKRGGEQNAFSVCVLGYFVCMGFGNKKSLICWQRNDWKLEFCFLFMIWGHDAIGLGIWVEFTLKFHLDDNMFISWFICDKIKLVPFDKYTSFGHKLKLVICCIWRTTKFCFLELIGQKFYHTTP